MVSLSKIITIPYDIVELDGLLGGTGEIPSVDVEKRAPMRFVIVLMVFTSKCYSGLD